MMKKINELVNICKKSQEELKSWLRNEMFKYYGKKRVKMTDDYLYVKGMLPVCLVSHLDTVHKVDPEKFLFDPVLNNLFSPTGIGGDDRCGVYIILELLKRDLRPSIIFCCDEEIGALGAEKFTKTYQDIKNVNWFLEFDRKGRTDVVAYDDGNEELTKVFESFGFKSDIGSFSDISELAPFYGISAVNVSSGYYKAHTTDEYINMDDLEWIIDKAEEILKSDYVNNSYKYIETYPNYSRYYHNYYDDYKYDYCSYDDYVGNSFNECEFCGTECKPEELHYTEFGMLCNDCIKNLELKMCNDCQRYVFVDKDGRCDICKNLVKEEEK